METLTYEQSSVDRSGAAQGGDNCPWALSSGFLILNQISCLFLVCISSIPCFFPPGLAEVMAGLGVEKLEKLMPEIVATASKVDIAPHVRDGYIMMFNYLPITFGDKFTPYVGPIIPCILKVYSKTEEFYLLENKKKPPEYFKYHFQ